MSTDCVFCREISGSRDTNFSRLYPESESRVIAETDSFIAFPCIGQLAEGHFLIVPKKHQNTLAQAQNGLSNFESELDRVLADAHVFLGAEQAESLYFEHGAFGGQHGGCGIYHAHLHIVPMAGHVSCDGLAPRGKTAEAMNLYGVYKSAPADKPYALFGSKRNGFSCWELAEPMESQTLRRFVAGALEVESWDWRKSGVEENMVSLLSRISA